MTGNTNSNFAIAPGFDLFRTVTAPLRWLDTAMSAVVECNQIARDYETLSRASDKKLAEMGIKRSEIAPFLARRSELMTP